MEIKRWHSPIITIIFSGLMVFVADFIIKGFFIKLGAKPFLSSQWFNLKLVPNENLAFSLPMNQTVAIFISIMAILILVYYLTVSCRDGRYNSLWAINLVIWGALGNLYDRLSYGFVVDYVSIGMLPIFNLSDLAIMFGLIYLLYINNAEEKRQFLEYKSA